MSEELLLVKPEFPLVVDSTMRGDFVACPHKFYEGYILKRALPGGAVDLTAGGAFAKGLEIVRGLVWGPEKLSLDDALANAIPRVWAEYGDIPVPEDKQHKSALNVIRALTAYFDKYDPATDHIRPYMKQDGYPATEFTFTIPTQVIHPDTGEPLIYAGRTDLLGVYQDSIWIVDDKTAGALGPSWDRSWALRGQLTGYTFAANYMGYKAQGAIVRGISFLKTGAFGFSEPIEYRSNWQMERWWVQLHRDLTRMVHCWQDKSEEHPYGYWDYSFADACTSFNGCQFAQLCKVSNPDEWAKGTYELRDWSPLDRNPQRQQIKSFFTS